MFRILPIVNEPFQNGQSFIRSHQSGEISPNLVTLGSEGTSLVLHKKHIIKIKVKLIGRAELSELLLNWKKERPETGQIKFWKMIILRKIVEIKILMFFLLHFLPNHVFGFVCLVIYIFSSTSLVAKMLQLGWEPI